ncbi:hypothetical protein DFH08DRAFT_979212 [Mycena albidolilacea]|uniref:S-adenosyl-L-methionine-dependent methyltransferase n=1 Tax=Mycena albidolilacea TaxID=1033008 RepID=A0AAD6YXR6_9AGAR|nr:hypothetical protein DFH08DRAFT_979212 [Mycena albidolilacea]
MHPRLPRKTSTVPASAIRSKLSSDLSIDAQDAPNTPFDLIFIDADKPGNLNYTEAKRLVRKGGVIVCDNVVRCGRVADLEYTDVNVEGVRALLKAEKGDKDVETTTISIVGDKRYDRFMHAIRK